MNNYQYIHTIMIVNDMNYDDFINFFELNKN